MQHQRDIAIAVKNAREVALLPFTLGGSVELGREGSITMKLIPTAEVDHLGTAGDTVEVKDGYGRNYLLPRGLAIVATVVRRAAEGIRRAQEPRPCATASTPTRSRPPWRRLGPISLPVKAGRRRRQAVRLGDRERHRRGGHQEGRRPEPGQAGPSGCPAMHIKGDGHHPSVCICTPMWRST